MSDKIAKFGVGRLVANFAALQAVDLAFDWVLYPAVLLALGTLKGGVVMTCLSLFNCSLLFIYSEKMKEKNPDLFKKLIGDVRRMRQIQRRKTASWLSILNPTNWFGFFFRWLFARFGWWLMKKLNHCRWIGFIVISIIRDPFQTMLWFRAGKRNKLGVRDWALFFLSGIICNVAYTIRVGAILWPLKVEAELLWNMFFKVG